MSAFDPDREPLMTYHPEKPGYFELLRGEGEDWAMIAIARYGSLAILFTAAFCLFSALA